MLAASGARVTIYEARDQVGGRTGRVELAAPDGRAFRFDRGPTFFLMPHVLAEVFAAAGARLEDHAELIRLDPMYRLLIGRPGERPTVLDTTQDVREMARRIGAISEADGRNFERFIADSRAKLCLSGPILRNPMRSPADVLRATSPALLPMLKPHKSVHALLGEYFDDERTKLAVGFQSKYLGMSPYDCPSLFTILPIIEYEYGVWHPIGGCAGLVRAMAGLAGSVGVDIRLGAPVERITFDGRRADGVVIGGERTAHDAVVVNADATWALKNLVPAELRTGPAKGVRDAAIERKRYSCSTVMLYLGLDGEVDLPHHTIYTSASYRENLEAIAAGTPLSDDPSMYVCNAARTDPSLAPPGGTPLYVLLPAPNLAASGGTDWAAETERLRGVAYAQLERVFGVERPERRTVCAHTIDPTGWAAMNINRGATFNLGHQLTQMLHMRPQNRLRGFDRLYLVGGGTHPGSGLPTIFLSSQISSALACEDLGLPNPLDRAAPAAMPEFEAARPAPEPAPV